MIANPKWISPRVAQALTRERVMDNVISTMRQRELLRAADKAYDQRGGDDPVYCLADAADNLKRGKPAYYAPWPSVKNG
jgi:hypothetical protein